MLNLNNVTLAGNMTRDAEVNATPKGTKVAKFGLAINRVWRDDQGNRHEDTTFVDCEAWGRTAEIIEEHTGKGYCICIEGRLKLDQWKDKQTQQNRSKLSVVVEKFHFVSKPRSEEAQEERETPPPKKTRQEYKPKSRPEPNPDLDAPTEEDDVPF